MYETRYTISQPVVKYSSMHQLFTDLTRTVFIMWWDAVVHIVQTSEACSEVEQGNHRNQASFITRRQNLKKKKKNMTPLGATSDRLLPGWNCELSLKFTSAPDAISSCKSSRLPVSQAFKALCSETIIHSYIHTYIHTSIHTYMHQGSG